AVVDVEHRIVDQPIGVDVVAGRQLRVHPVDALGRAEQALPAGILADLEQDLPDRLLDRAVVDELGPAGVALDLVGSDVGLADLGLDLVDELLDVRRKLGWAGHPGDGTRRGRRTVPVRQRPEPSAPKPAAGNGSYSRPSAPRSQARAFAPSDGRWEPPSWRRPRRRPTAPPPR